MKQAIVLYLHVHQPFRTRHYTIFDAGMNHDYFFDQAYDRPTNNERIIKRVAEKSYLPTNQLLLELLTTYPAFCISLSMSGTVLEQLERWAPAALQSFRELFATGRVELLAETYHHSLAFFYNREEFEAQVALHRAKAQQLFGITPRVFRNTELAYNNDVAYWADRAGYKGVLAEGWDAILGWRSPNYVYRPSHTDAIRVLFKNYKLSDDIAFRFDDKSWSEWPLTAQKFVSWLNQSQDSTNFNLFMDYETFGEHHWEDGGIFGFLRSLPAAWLKTDDHRFMTISDAIDTFEAVDYIDAPTTTTWADNERDLSAWNGNAMQQEALRAIYGLRDAIIQTGDTALIEDWRKLQASDHYYYMSTKRYNDGNVHAYFSPYDSPYDAFITHMNVFHDLQFRLARTGGSG